MGRKAIPLVIGGVILGFLLTLTAGTVISKTNEEAFCISCHEMRETVYMEYKDTLHATNHAGIKVECSDCHVPKELGPKLVRKVLAVKDIYHHLLGTVDTPEKFEEHRLAMAKQVWSYMKASDSRECRSCHSFEAMDFDEQDRSANKKHHRAMESGETCIDCHKGVAHELPDFDEEDLEL